VWQLRQGAQCARGLALIAGPGIETEGGRGEGGSKQRRGCRAKETVARSSQHGIGGKRGLVLTDGGTTSPGRLMAFRQRTWESLKMPFSRSWHYRRSREFCDIIRPAPRPNWMEVISAAPGLRPVRWGRSGNARPDSSAGHVAFCSPDQRFQTQTLYCVSLALLKPLTVTNSIKSRMRFSEVTSQ
jgi:hypothetical protein